MQSSANILQQYPGAIDLYSRFNSWIWAISKSIRLLPGPFTMNGHEFQKRIMSVRPRVKTTKKATQFTITESEILNVLNGMINGYYPVGVYYLLPSLAKVFDFSRTRFKTLIHQNPHEIGRFVHDTDSVSLKRIGNGFLYFKSGRLSQNIGGDQMKSSANLKGDPADHAVYDEWDEMDPEAEGFVKGRLAKSKRGGTESFLANPTLPDYGVDLKFQESSQEYWHIKCLHCGHYTCLDDEADYVDDFPKQIRRQGGLVIRACSNPRCERLLDPRNGEWVARKPNIKDHLGFTIGHPSAYWVDPAQLLREWEHPNTNKANFIRLKLGKAYVEAENRLAIDEVLNCCSTHGITSSDPGPCFMGVDQGGINKDLFHLSIGKKHESFAGKTIHIGIYQGWEELDRLMKIFHIIRCVIDALPNTDDARKFAYRHKGKIFLSYYNENQKGVYKWNEKDYTVQSNRTESLDSSHKEISTGSVLLPKKCEIVKTYAAHLHATAKKLVEDPKTGSKRYIYIPKLGGPDHFRHAQNYEAMARQEAPDLLFPEML